MLRIGLMARISLFCTVGGRRPLPCRSLFLIWKRGLASTTTQKLMPPQMGGGNVVAVPRPFATTRLGSHWRADGSQPAWRKSSHHTRGVTTFPEAKGGQHLPPRRQQQQQTATAKDTEDEITNDEGNVIPKFKSDSKQMLKIPQEEWPR